MAIRPIQLTIASPIAVIWLNRQEVHNAIDGPMVEALEAALASVEANNSVRALVLAGHGPSFCAGIDVRWMNRMGRASKAVNLKDAAALADLLRRLDSFKKPTVARVHGSTYAGGIGLIASCDIAVSSLDAEFCVSETRLGLAAATIAPYLVRAIGNRQARRYLLTAERFSAAEAYRIGLIHELAPPDELDAKVNEILGQLLLGGPMAVPTAKENIAKISDFEASSSKLFEEMARQTANLRATKEGTEGICAFLEKRAPVWTDAKTRKLTRKNSPKRNFSASHD